MKRLQCNDRSHSVYQRSSESKLHPGGYAGHGDEVTMLAEVTRDGERLNGACMVGGYDKNFYTFK